MLVPFTKAPGPALCLPGTATCGWLAWGPHLSPFCWGRQEGESGDMAADGCTHSGKS